MSRRSFGIALLALLAVVVTVIGIERSASRGNDFDTFYDAAASVWREGDLLEEKGTLRYPPTFQVLISPLGLFPIEGAAVVWLLLNYAGYAATWWGLARLSGAPTGRQGWAWLGVAPFVVSNVTLGQSGPLLLGLATVGIWAAARGRSRAGGVAITVAGLLKVFPGALLAVPVVLGRVRATLAGALLALAVTAAWVGLAVGPGEGAADLARWIREVRTEQNPVQMIESVRSLRYNNQGLAITLVRSLSTEFSYAPRLAAKGSVQVLSLPSRVVWLLYDAILALLAVVLAACVWRLRRARRAPTPRTFLGLYAMAIPAMLALSPIVWTHYFLWLLPPLVYLAHRRGLVIALGTFSVLANFSVPARALGAHMGLGLVLFGLAAWQLWRETAPWPETPGPGEAQ